MSAANEGRCHHRPKAPPPCTHSKVGSRRSRQGTLAPSAGLSCSLPETLSLLFPPKPKTAGPGLCLSLPPPPRTGHLEAGADSLQPPRRKPLPTPTLFLCSSLVGEVCALSEESGQHGCGRSCSGLLGPECTERVPSQGGGPHPSCSSTLCSLTRPRGLSDRAPSPARKPHLTDRTLCCKLENPMLVDLSRKVASS